jgi:hypothetical protein
MKRDTVKTLAGLLVIAVIVVATFVYGNSQRQAQLKHDQEVKNQEVASNRTAMPSSSPQATASTAPSKSPQSNTAPVSTPQSNSIQGGRTATPSSSPKASATPAPTATPSSSPIASASEPKTGGSDPLPQTGASLGDLTGVAAIIFAVVWLRYSKRAVVSAARNRR